MTCEEAHSWLSAHLDHEVDLANSIDLERHLAGCPACRREREAGAVLRDAIRAADLYYDAPATLANKVRASVNQAARPTEPRSWWFAWRWPAFGALAVAAMIAAVWLRPAPPPPVIAELVASHVRSLQANHLLDIVSSDRHTVKPWFQGKLDFAPPVPDLPELAGGRLDYVNGRQVAALVYQRRRHPINVFVWPSHSAGGMSTESVNGYQLVHWYASGMEWWAVSDMNASELTEFARILAQSPALPNSP